MPLFLFILIYITYIQSITFIQYIHLSSFAEVPLHLLIAGQLSWKTSLECRAENRTKASAFQQADAQPTELRRTHSGSYLKQKLKDMEKSMRLVRRCFRRWTEVERRCSWTEQKLIVSKVIVERTKLRECSDMVVDLTKVKETVTLIYLWWLSLLNVHHGPINYKDTKPYVSSLLLFNRVYRLGIQSVMFVFSTSFVNYCPSNLLSS